MPGLGASRLRKGVAGRKISAARGPSVTAQALLKIVGELFMSTVLSRAHVIALLLLVTTVAAQEMPKSQPPLWSAKPDVAAFEKMENDRLAAAQRAIDQIVAVKGSRTIENTLGPYDEAIRQLNAAGYFSGLMQQVHPGRGLSRPCDCDDHQGERRADGPVAESRRLPGAGKLRCLQGRCRDRVITCSGNCWSFVWPAWTKTMRRGQAQETSGSAHRRSVDVRPQHLRRRADRRSRRCLRAGRAAAGLHRQSQARRDGKIHITTNYPDVFPVLNFAKSDGLRRRLWEAF